MSIQLITAPAVPLSWDDDVKGHLRLDTDEEQPRVDGTVIPAAGQWLETFTNRSLITRTYKLYLDHFPGYCYSGCSNCSNPYRASSAIASPIPLEIPRPPLQSITHIKYYDGDGVLQTWSSTLYDIDPPIVTPATGEDFVFLPECQPWRVYPKAGQSWPSHRTQRNAIEIQFVCGYGDKPKTIPGNLRAAMLLMVGEMFERREQSIVGSMVSDARLTAERLAWPFRVNILGAAA